MICPEDLLDRQGSLSAQEQRMLATHLARCAACALQASLVVPPWDDPARTERAAERAMKALTGRARHPASRWPWVVLSGAAALVAIAALAFTLGAPPPDLRPSGLGRRPAFTLGAPPPDLRPFGLGRRPAPPGGRAAESSSSAASSRGEASGISVEDLPAASNPGPVRATAGELFARANAARQAGRRDEALGLYRALERDYPTSSEAATAHVTMARLLEANDVGTALVEYDAYLANASNVDLREEALGGRARALERLGRASEERAAWQELLARYPDSLQAAHARRRLEAGP